LQDFCPKFPAPVFASFFISPDLPHFAWRSVGFHQPAGANSRGGKLLAKRSSAPDKLVFSFILLFSKMPSLSVGLILYNRKNWHQIPPVPLTRAGGNHALAALGSKEANRD
jgi:hypothetical protein